MLMATHQPSNAAISRLRCATCGIAIHDSTGHTLVARAV